MIRLVRQCRKGNSRMLLGAGASTCMLLPQDIGGGFLNTQRVMKLDFVTAIP